MALISRIFGKSSSAANGLQTQSSKPEVGTDVEHLHSQLELSAAALVKLKQEHAQESRVQIERFLQQKIVLEKQLFEERTQRKEEKLALENAHGRLEKKQETLAIMTKKGEVACWNSLSACQYLHSVCESLTCGGMSSGGTGD